MRPVIIEVVHSHAFIQKLDKGVWRHSKIQRTINAGRYLHIEDVALLEGDSPIDERLIRSDRYSQRICVRLKRCQQAQEK